MVSFNGNSIAATPEILSVTRIVRKPEEMNEKTGTYRSTQDRMQEQVTTNTIGKECLQGGIIMAINMPYKAMPSEAVTEAGSAEQIKAPNAVPRDHPIIGPLISPNKYQLVRGLSSEEATANVSSVMPNENKKRSPIVTWSSSRWDKDNDINM